MKKLSMDAACLAVISLMNLFDWTIHGRLTGFALEQNRDVLTCEKPLGHACCANPNQSATETKPLRPATSKDKK
jgi:hypothetical protein